MKNSTLLKEGAAHPDKGQSLNLFVFLFMLLTALLLSSRFVGQAPFVYTANGTWVCPAGVTSITVECWGAGGGGGQRNTNNTTGGGGGGGAYAASILPVIPGNSYTIAVGAGGNGAASGTKNGGNSSFAASVIALGGAGATNNSTTAGNGGSASSSTGTIKHSGANGSVGGTNSGAGGGAAGRTAGGTGINSGGLYGGNGGASQAAQGNGNPGATYGGGGSGGKRTTSGTRAGGNGAGGLVLITVNDGIWQNPVLSPSTINSSSPFMVGDIVASNLSVSGISKGSVPSAVTSSNIYEASGWTSGSLNANAYFQFTLTPANGYMINLTSFSYSGVARSNGFASAPNNFAVRSSLDGYTTNIGSVGANGSVDLSGINYQAIASPVTFRVYAWGGSVILGTDYFGINGFAFRGTTTPILPPTINTFLPTNTCQASGESVVITGTNFSGASNVSFNGTSASYTINSTTQITATLPIGATSGQISVSTPGGIVYSSGIFTVYSLATETLFADNFNDGSISDWTNSGWQASTSSPINGSHSLFTSSSFWNSERRISKTYGQSFALSAGETTWRFNINTNYGVLGSEDLFVFLTSDNGNVATGSTLNGYALRFKPNFFFVFVSQSIDLCKITNGVATVISGTTYTTSDTFLGVEVVRSASGNWNFKTDNNGNFDNLIQRSTATDSQYNSGTHIGIRMSNLFGGEIRFDDFSIEQKICEQVYYSQSDGNYTDAIWHRERIGGTPHTVTGNEHVSFVIQNTHDVAPNGSGWTADNLTVENGGRLDFTSSTNNYPLSLHGNLANQNGIITSNNEIISFVGSAPQTIYSQTKLVLNDLIINNGNTVTLPSNVLTEIKPLGIITIPNGTLITNDSLYLSSRIQGTAAIGAIASGSSLVGKISLERFIPNMTITPIGGNGSWVAAGTPLTGATIQHWNNTIVTTGYPGADFPPPGYSFNNIQWYNESYPGAIGLGYTGVQSNSEVLSPKRGYFIYTYPTLSAPQNLLRVHGNIQQGSFNDTVYYSNTGNPTADGWNLLVNRYPSEVDFKSMAEAGAGAITYYHLFDAETNSYRVYHTNSPSNAPRYIASGQAFFVKSSSLGSYLRYQEGFKSNQGVAFERDAEESSYAAIKFYKAANNADECVINFNNDATPSFENDFDAIKLHSPEPTAAECALVGEDGTLMTIDSRPLGQENSISIPVYVEMPNSGTYRLRIEHIHNLPFGSCLFVEDLLTGNTIPFEIGQELVIAHTGNYSGNRFLIHATPSIATSETNLDCFGAANGSVQIVLPQGEWSLAMADTLGGSFNLTEGTTAFENLPAGQYIVSATNALGNCPSSQKTISISEPAEMVLHHLNSFVDHCNASNNGSVEWVLSNATNYNYTLSNQSGEIISSGVGGSGAILLSNLSADIYTITINNFCGTQSFETSLIDNNVVNAEILSENISLVLAEGQSQSLNIGQSSLNATHFAWMMNNNLISQTEILSYDFSELGNNSLVLYAYNENCSATDTISIFIDRAISVDEEMNQAPISFLQTKESLEMYLNMSSSDMTAVTVYDANGRIVWNMTTSTWSGKNISIGTGSFASGVYVVKTTVGDKEILNKKFINP